jgi:putative DNA primase/helicase
MLDPLKHFREALASRNIIPPDNLVADGRIHRCNTEGKNGKNDGAYLLHLDGVPAGGFQNHRDGLGWFNWRAPLRRSLTSTEQAAHQAKLAAIRREREIDEAARRRAAGKRAEAIWRNAKPASDDHPYLRLLTIVSN